MIQIICPICNEPMAPKRKNYRFICPSCFRSYDLKVKTDENGNEEVIIRSLEKKRERWMWIGVLVCCCAFLVTSLYHSIRFLTSLANPVYYAYCGRCIFLPRYFFWYDWPMVLVGVAITLTGLTMSIIRLRKLKKNLKAIEK